MAARPESAGGADLVIAEAVQASSPVLELSSAIAAGAVVYFCLPALQFPALAKTLGKVVINDLKSAANEQLGRPESARRPIYTVFDEFSVFAGEQVLNVINMGRSAGIHAVLATQSVADLGRATPETPDHFTRQVFSSCNNYLVHRLNAPEDAQLGRRADWYARRNRAHCPSRRYGRHGPRVCPKNQKLCRPSGCHQAAAKRRSRVCK